MSTPKSLNTIFEALAHHHRRDIIYALSLQPQAISHLATSQNLSLPAIYKHIKILKQAELIIQRKIGRIHFLTLKREKLMELQQWLMQYHAYWGSDKETLENYSTYLMKGGEKK